MDKRTKVTLYGVCGMYLLYMAYKMFRTVLEMGAAEAMLSLVFSILFVIMGIIVLVFTYRMSRDIKKEDEEAAEKAALVSEDGEKKEEPEEVPVKDSGEI